MKKINNILQLFNFTFIHESDNNIDKEQTFSGPKSGGKNLENRLVLIGHKNTYTS